MELPQLLNRIHRLRRLELSAISRRPKRQYVGFVRGDRRSIYVNVFPDVSDLMEDWETEPAIVCDGGAQFFGAEFDLESCAFTHVAHYARF